jgi:hypothetical protein
LPFPPYPVSAQPRVGAVSPDEQMQFNSRTMQRLFLAFTTGLFLACAARISAANAQTPTAAITP